MDDVSGTFLESNPSTCAQYKYNSSKRRRDKSSSEEKKNREEIICYQTEGDNTDNNRSSPIRCCLWFIVYISMNICER